MADEANKTDGLLNNPGAVSVDDPAGISEDAQDVAKATGVAYEDMTKPPTAEVDAEGNPVDPYRSYDAEGAGATLDDNVKFKDAIGDGTVGNEGYVNEDKSTVGGQLNSLLDSDSPYIQQARQQGTEQAASRGLLNSSFGAGAAQREAIGAALPIAQQDAQTFANAQATQQKADYGIETIQGEAIVSGEVVKQQESIKQTNQNINNAFTASIQAASAQDKIWLQDMQNTFANGQQELIHNQNAILQEADISASRAESVRTQFSNVMQNYQVTVENMMMDPDFLLMGKDGVNNAILQTQTLAKQSMGLIGTASGMLAEELDELFSAYIFEDDFIQSDNQLPTPVE